MLRNPAYAGTAVFGKTMVLQESAGLNRVVRLQGRSVPRATRTTARPRGEWTEIPVPAIVTAETFQRAQQRLADNKRFAARNTKVPSLLQSLAACSACGYGYYRTSTRTTNKTIYYYRCLGSDDYRERAGTGLFAGAAARRRKNGPHSRDIAANLVRKSAARSQQTSRSQHYTEPTPPQ